MLNEAKLIGNLGRDPEIRHLQDGKKIAQLSIATTDKWKDKQTGEKKEHTEWHRVVIFVDGIAKVAEDYLKKGSRVYVAGSLRTRKWQDDEGKDRYSTEIQVNKVGGKLVLLGDPSGSGVEKGTQAAQDAALDDDIPF